MTRTTIAGIRGRRVWDSRGRPTVEAEIRLEGGATGRAIAPAGASTGSGEARDKRDGGAAFGGHDVQGAVASRVRKHCPSASRPGQSAPAMLALTTSTSGAPIRSEASRPRPRRIRVPIVRK